jgi:hypothetical protein
MTIFVLDKGFCDVFHPKLLVSRNRKTSTKLHLSAKKVTTWSLLDFSEGRKSRAITRESAREDSNFKPSDP